MSRRGIWVQLGDAAAAAAAAAAAGKMSEGQGPGTLQTDFDTDK